MKIINTPKFTAETSLRRTRAKYRMTGGHGSLPETGAVVPQASVCSPCTNVIAGRMSCCDIKVGRDPNGRAVVSMGRCRDQNCGALSGLIDLLDRLM
jgi:hypothetical protein